MKKLNAALVTVLSLIIISGVMFNTLSFASSINTTSGTNKISKSVPKSELKSARIYAEALALGKSESELQTVLTSHELKQVLIQEKISQKVFREEVRTEMVSYLTQKGYTQTQILSSINSRYIKSHKNNI